MHRLRKEFKQAEYQPKISQEEAKLKLECMLLVCPDCNQKEEVFRQIRQIISIPEFSR